MSTSPPTDEQLIESMRRRDVKALELFYDRHRVLAYSLAVKALSNPNDAEDVVQEAFLSVWRGAAGYLVQRSAPRSWLLSIVHHRAIDKLRNRRSRPQSSSLEEDMNIPDTHDVWNEVAGNLTGADVRAALDRLPAEQRQTIQLAYFEGYTHVQIAEMMEVPLGTVKGRMRIGLHKLRSLLQGIQAELVTD
jgi:RNA polymerase sigma-70 factor, ECF subfamily